MILHASLAPIRDCTDPFRVGAELDVSLWLSAVHVYNPRNRLFDSHAFAKPGLPPTLHQAVANAARPDLTLLRSTVTRVDLVNKTVESGEVLDRSRSRVWASDPLELSIGFRQLQQGNSAVPKEVGEPLAALGFLSAFAHGTDKPIRVRVDAVLALDLEPLSPTFGTWRNDEVWIEGAVDVSNLNETTVIARLSVIEG